GIGVNEGEDGKLSTAICAPPGRYILSLMPPVPPSVYIKSIKLNGQDFTNRTMDLATPMDRALDVVLSGRASVLHVSLRPGSEASVSGVPVTIWNNETGYNATFLTDLHGGFEFVNLPPGDYRIAGWEDLHSQPPGKGIQTVPEFRASFDALATKLQFAEAQTV